MYDSHHKQQAIALRLAGKSYGDIRKALGVKSKGTISVWLRGLRLTPNAEKLLHANIERATTQKLLAFNNSRTERIRKENEDARDEGMKKIGSLSRRDLLILGASLYWGEGSKAERDFRYHSLSFSNSDPEMIGVFLRFVREILKVPEQKIYAAMHIYKSIDEDMARQFWATCTRLDPTRFTASYQVSRAGKGIRKTLPYGTLNIRVHNRLQFYTLKGMIAGLAKLTN